LHEIAEEKTRGSIIRSRTQWYEEGEKCSKFFLNLENRHFTERSIPTLLTEEGEEIKSQKEITQEMVNFYAKLYKSRTVDYTDTDFLDDLPKLTEESKGRCDGRLTLIECGKALMSMSNGKSPGGDGYPAEFFKFFWKHLGTFVVNSLNYAYDNGTLSETQRLGYITCIPKQDKDRKYIKNWRPITLLSTVYKIGSKALAERVKGVLPEIISQNQKGFIKDRFMHENTRIVYDLLQYTANHNIPGLLVLVDFEKAFDSLEWSFLWKAMQRFNFGESFIQWVKVFYTDIKSCILCNGGRTDFFDICRGCRQGDPLSPYLFIIGLEILSRKLQKSNRMSGLTIGGKTFLNFQYADDMFIFLEPTALNLKNLFETLDSVAGISGLRVNISKSMVVRIGSLRDSQQVITQDIPVVWHRGSFKLLGIVFHVHLENTKYWQTVKFVERAPLIINRKDSDFESTNTA
jgi:hypothetical protein